MFLIVGLGNPGKEYEKTRHNAGFMAIDKLAEDNCASSFKKKFQGLYTECEIAREKVILLKPQTYMNLSGNSVAEATKFFKINKDNVIVIHDEIDLEFGREKVKKGGGNAGHNGLKSIDAAIGNDFIRIRIGVGRPSTKNEVSDYVLGNFSKAEKEQLDDIMDKIAKIVEEIIDENRKGLN